MRGTTVTLTRLWGGVDGCCCWFRLRRRVGEEVEGVETEELVPSSEEESLSSLFSSSLGEEEWRGLSARSWRRRGAHHSA